MFEIKQFRYSADNLSYVVRSESSVLAIDGGAVGEILAYVADCGCALDFVTITHDHPDHTVGNHRLLSRTEATYLDHKELGARGHFSLGNKEIRVIPTPGHTEDSVIFNVEGALITGDTLFNGTVGNCFSFDLHAFLDSIKNIMKYPSETLVYPGHDYVADSMEYARSLDPDNPAINTYLSQYNPSCVVSTLGEELKMNPFLRFNDPEIIAMLKDRGLPHDTEFERWQSLME